MFVPTTSFEPGIPRYDDDAKTDPAALEGADPCDAEEWEGGWKEVGGKTGGYGGGGSQEGGAMTKAAGWAPMILSTSTAAIAESCLLRSMMKSYQKGRKRVSTSRLCARRRSAGSVSELVAWVMAEVTDVGYVFNSSHCLRHPTRTSWQFQFTAFNARLRMCQDTADQSSPTSETLISCGEFQVGSMAFHRRWKRRRAGAREVSSSSVSSESGSPFGPVKAKRPASAGA